MKLRLLAVAGVLVTTGVAGGPGTPYAAAAFSAGAGPHHVAVPGVPGCRLRQLRLGDGAPVPELTQQETRIFVLRNTSAQRCELTGYPVVALLTGGGRFLPFRYRDHGDQMLASARPRAVVLAARGGRAYFGINKSACVTRAAAIAATLTAWPRGQLTVRVPPYFDYCGRPDPGHVLDVSPFETSVRAVLAW